VSTALSLIWRIETGIFNFLLFLIFWLLNSLMSQNSQDTVPMADQNPNWEPDWLEGRVERCCLSTLCTCWGHRLHQENRKHLWQASPWVISSCWSPSMRTKKALGRETAMLNIHSFSISTSTSQNGLIASLLLCYFVVWLDQHKRMCVIHSFFVISTQIVYRCLPTSQMGHSLHVFTSYSPPWVSLLKLQSFQVPVH